MLSARQPWRAETKLVKSIEPSMPSHRCCQSICIINTMYYSFEGMLELKLKKNTWYSAGIITVLHRCPGQFNQLLGSAGPRASVEGCSLLNASRMETI